MKTNDLKPSFFIALFWIFIFTFFTQPIQGSAGELDFLSLEEKLESIRSSYNIPTVHAGVTCNTELVWTRGFGNQTALDTVFPIASIQKPFVGTAILQLYEQGLIDLDADISNYLPFEVKHHYYPEDRITIRMLLTHTSGLASEINYEFYWDTEGHFTPSSEYNPSILDMSLGDYLNESFTPGGNNYYPSMWLYRPSEQYSYSNTGFKLLQYLVEYNIGRTFEEYLQEYIFSPCEMMDSSINASNFLDNHAIPYTRNSGINRELPVYSSWMIRTTVTDLSHFLIAHLNNGKYGEYQILSTSTIELMHKNIVQYSTHRNKLVQDVTNYNFYQHSYGLGWSQFHDGFGGHGGSTPGFIVVMAGRKYSVGGSIGVILFMNVNAILGSSEDKTEVQLAYKELINTILFELALIPIINQASVDLLIFFATISLTMILLSHHGSRIIQKRKDPSQAQSSRGKIGYLLHYLCIMGLGGLTIMNFFYLYDWIKLLLLLPIVIYSGIIILHCSKYKKDGVFPPYFNDRKITTVLQVWLTISIIGLALYNLTYSHLPTIITTILCLGSILLILVDSYSNTRV